MSDGDALARIEAAIGALARDVEGLRVDIDELLMRGRLTADERTLLRALLPLVASATRGAAFSALDVIDMAGARSVVGGWCASDLARLLGRACGARFGSVRVERAGRDRAGVLWSATTCA